MKWFALLAAMCLPALPWAQIVYVDPINGNDSVSNGSLSSPVKTIQYAISLKDSASPSYTITLLKGVYYEHVVMCWSLTGDIVIESANPLINERAVWVLDSTQADSARVECGGSLSVTSFNTLSILGSINRTVIIRNINFVGTNKKSSRAWCFLGITGQPNLTIEGCIFTCEEGGISAISLMNSLYCQKFDNISIINNIFFNIQEAPLISFATSQEDPEWLYPIMWGDPHENWNISNNAILNCSNNSEGLINIIEQNTYCKQTGPSATCYFGTPIRTFHVSDVHVTNNIFSNIPSGGCLEHRYLVGDTNYHPTDGLDSVYPYEARNNVFFNVNGIVSGQLQERTKWITSGNILNVDPQLTCSYEAVAHIFTIGTVSSAGQVAFEGAGANTYVIPYTYFNVFEPRIDVTRNYAPLKDFNGKCRFGVNDNTCDIGPFEFNGTVGAQCRDVATETILKKACNSAELWNSPNPFNPTTTIYFSLYSGIINNATLLIYDVRGNLIQRFDLGSKANGRVVWNGTNMEGRLVSSGIYIYKIESGKTLIKNAKMVLYK